MNRHRALAPRAAATLLGAAMLSGQAAPPAGDPTGFATAAEVTAVVARMEAEMRPGQTFLWRPLVRGDGAVAALEYWKAPGRPAVHPTETEYAIVVAGAGTLRSGGRLVDPVDTKPGLVEGGGIDGGTTRPLRPGDVLLIPAGVPHWFGVDRGKLVLLGTKFPR